MRARHLSRACFGMRRAPTTANACELCSIWCSADIPPAHCRTPEPGLPRSRRLWFATCTNPRRVVLWRESQGGYMGHSTAILRLSFLLFLMLDSCRLGVFSNSRVTLITVTPANPTSIVGATHQFLAHVTHKDEITIHTTAVTWRTSNPTHASISSSGTPRGVNPGTVAIVATLDGVSGSTVLTVTASTPHTVSVTGGPGKLVVAFLGNAQPFVYGVNPFEQVISLCRLGA